VSRSPKNRFWNSLRLEEAMQQMSSSQASLTSVASRLGFDAQCNFTRFFRQHTGVAPSEYRHVLMRHTDAAALGELEADAQIARRDGPRRQALSCHDIVNGRARA
jgi:hypothetical protein